MISKDKISKANNVKKIHPVYQQISENLANIDVLLAAVKKRGKLADIDDGNRPSILVNKKGARYGPFLL
jgi:hypothetical protein